MPHIDDESPSKQESAELIKYITRQPSTSSRLGDIGYVDRKGRWHGVVNIFDQGSCQRLGIKALKLATNWLQYITTRQYGAPEKPWIDLYPEGRYQLVTPDELERALVSESIPAPNIPDYHEQIAACTIGLLIYPSADTTLTAFIAGLQIFARTIHLPFVVLQSWLRTYNTQIVKSARKQMDITPPADRSEPLCLGLTEFYSEAWRMLYIRSDSKASPLALGWKPGVHDGPGTWIIFEVPDSGTVVHAGFSSFRVYSNLSFTKVVAGSNKGMGLWK